MIKTENYIKEVNFLFSYGKNVLREIYKQQTSDSCSLFYISSTFFPNNYLEVDFYMFDKQGFNNFLLLDKGLGEVTREGHIKSLNSVFKKINKEEPEHSDFRNHILWMYSQDYSYSHITNTSKAIEYFTEFQENPLKIARTKRPKSIIKDFLTEAEVNTIIRTSKDLREKAMITLLAYSGVRNKEFCNIKVKDIDFGNNSLRVNKGKNSKDRIINISSVCSNILVDYLLEYKKEKEDFLFTTIKRNKQYQTSDLRKFVKVLAKRAGIEKRVFPHIFRHSLATNLLKRGANLITIKEQLGHNFIQSTMVYLRIIPEIIKSEYEHYLPAYV